MYLLNKTSKLYFSSFDTSRLDNHAVLLRLFSVAILLEAALSIDVHTDTLLLFCGYLFTDFDAVAGTAAATTSLKFYAAAALPARRTFFYDFTKGGCRPIAGDVLPLPVMP